MKWGFTTVDPHFLYLYFCYDDGMGFNWFVRDVLSGINDCSVPI